MFKKQKWKNKHEKWKIKYRKSKHKCISRQTKNKNKRNEKKPKPHKTRRDAYKTQIADKIEGKYNKTTSKKELEISIKRCSNWAGPLSLARVRYAAIWITTGDQ
jgi:hypothetical protein